MLGSMPTTAATQMDWTTFGGDHYSQSHMSLLIFKNTRPPWWGHQMEQFSALLAFCEGNSPVAGEFPTQRSVTQSFDVLFDLRHNKQLSKQSWGWWFEMPLCPLWCQCNTTWVLVEQHVHANIKENTKTLYHWPFERGIHWLINGPEMGLFWTNSQLSSIIFVDSHYVTVA